MRRLAAMRRLLAVSCLLRAARGLAPPRRCRARRAAPALLAVTPAIARARIATREEQISALEAEATKQMQEADAELSLTMEDFELLRMVGKGGYGKVFQVRCTINNEVYAMKVVDKASVERYRSMDNIATELSVLRRYAEARHPFILGLECAFQSASKLHFVMEYVPGGMLFAHLRSHEMFSEKMARFYAAEVCILYDCN